VTQTPAGAFEHTNVNSAGTTNIKKGPGVLRSVTINTKGGAGHTATIFDGLDATGQKIAAIDATNQITLIYDIAFKTGLTLVTAGGNPADITISWA
jgi:hypothetical protein